MLSGPLVWVVLVGGAGDVEAPWGAEGAHISLSPRPG